MTLSERLRAAAQAERLADWVRVTQGSRVIPKEAPVVSWRLQGGESGREGWDEIESEWSPLLMVLDFYSRGPRGGYHLEWRTRPWCGGCWGELSEAHRTREAAIRSGLLALAEREANRD